MTKWVPQLRVVIILGNVEERVRLLLLAPLSPPLQDRQLADLDKPDQFDVVLSTYDTVRQEAGRLGRHSWQCLVVDEAHHMKNTNSALVGCLETFHARFRLLVTGTPFQVLSSLPHPSQPLPRTTSKSSTRSSSFLCQSFQVRQNSLR